MNRFSAIILAAGTSSRFGDENKLLADLNGKPVVRHVVDIMSADARFDTVHVVTGHQREAVEAALTGTGVRFIHNPDFASGMASSLVTGIKAAIAEDASHAMIVLGDMPLVDRRLIGKLLDASEADPECAIRPVHEGAPGNPVILPHSLFAAVAALKGDEGARRVLASGKVSVVDVECGKAAILDADTPEQLEAVRRQL